MTATDKTKSININDFDPVYRKTEFQAVRKGALGMIGESLTSKNNEQQNLELRKIGQ
jgi:hypothetical protein